MLNILSIEQHSNTLTQHHQGHQRHPCARTYDLFLYAGWD